MTILPPPLRDAGPLETMEAQAIDARSGETEGLDPKGESAVRQDAPEQQVGPLNTKEGE